MSAPVGPAADVGSPDSRAREIRDELRLAEAEAWQAYASAAQRDARNRRVLFDLALRAMCKLLDFEREHGFVRAEDHGVR